jgi:hypothetical protein
MSTADSPASLDFLALTAFGGCECSAEALRASDAILGLRPVELAFRILRDQESEASVIASRRLIAGFLSRPAPCGDDAGSQAALDTADAIAGHVARRRADIAQRVERLLALTGEEKEILLRQRALISMLAGCWLDTISQPATQPSPIVNHLFGHHLRLLGRGLPQRSLHYELRRALEQAGIFLPEAIDIDFPRKAGVRPLTAAHAAYYLSLSRFPATFLPEVVGTHYAFFALGIDDALYATAPMLDEGELRALVAEYLNATRGSADGESFRYRLVRAVSLVLALETEHVDMLLALAERHRGLSLDAKAAAIIERHGPFAGRQHRNIRIGGRKLSDVFADPPVDLARFMRDFRSSAFIKSSATGECRFLRAIKFGGPMFGIFDEREADIFKAWVAAVNNGEPAAIKLESNHVGDDAASQWLDPGRRHAPEDIVVVDPEPIDDRELFFRLVNIERFPNVLPLARARALQGLRSAEALFERGAAGKYTDASFFDYTPDALRDRIERIYWDKLINPYQALTTIPDREEVVFGQKTFALGNLIDGTWAFRIGNAGRFNRTSDGMLFAIYADEMGLGDLRKNHITLIHNVLRSMSIALPHIRDEAFKDQDELPDELYPFAIHQIGLALFPDSFYSEVLGYNLGIEMFGLGELRLHEIQKLRHWGFDATYEEAHLSIDNVSAGHARQSAEIVISYLDGIERQLGPQAVQSEWRRIWNGYASFALFVERGLASAPVPQDSGDTLEDVALVI